MLRERNIPFYSFYQMVDFAGTLSDEQAGRLEEALSRMEILDALVVSPDYREQVLALGEGVCDRYVFGDAAYISDNIMNCLEIDNGENDILFYQAISSVLTGIGVNCTKNENSTGIDAKGNYRLVGRKEQKRQEELKRQKGFERLLKKAKNDLEVKWLRECPISIMIFRESLI